MLGHFGVAVHGIGIPEINIGTRRFRADRRPADGRMLIVFGRVLHELDFYAGQVVLVGEVQQPRIKGKFLAVDDFDESFIEPGLALSGNINIPNVAVAVDDRQDMLAQEGGIFLYSGRIVGTGTGLRPVADDNLVTDLSFCRFHIELAVLKPEDFQLFGLVVSFCYFIGVHGQLLYVLLLV